VTGGRVQAGIGILSRNDAPVPPRAVRLT